MEHEVFVPVSPTRIGHALRSPARVTASLPGWQPDASGAADGADGADGSAPEGGAAGRLRLRVGGSTITYRGTVRVTGASSPFAAEASGTEVRGTGTVKATLEIVVAEATHPEPGALLIFRGAAQAEGRLASYEPDVVEAAVRRLLDRFSADLAAHAPEEETAPDPAPSDVTVEETIVPVVEAGAASERPESSERAESAERAESLKQVESLERPESAERPDEPGAEAGAADAAAEEAADTAGDTADTADDTAEDTADTPAGDSRITTESDPSDTDTDAAADSDEADSDEDAEPAEPEADVVDDLGEPAPPSDLDDFELVEVEVEVPESAAALDDLVPPAEAAHARRTMIGRSAEEVDHAPPRGRYAPVPAPDATSAAATLRWAAPAAAALVASAVVVGRVLRRRR
ncbi:CoxG family protein [Streptomyces sp. NPDC087422]|uniref:CoxG family protein n=1 Tax=Streptomyces sp. NPDC087422 TaxID=3365786 RepID=UPI00381D6648